MAPVICPTPADCSVEASAISRTSSEVCATALEIRSAALRPRLDLAFGLRSVPDGIQARIGQP